MNDQTYTEVSDQIERNSKKLIEIDNRIRVEWKKTVKSFESTVEKVRTDLSKKYETYDNASKIRTNKIKDICTDYFTKHEDNVKEIQGKVSGVTQAFDEWKMYVMNPQSINEARIHSLDIKCDEIETAVNNNFNIIYAIVKKLLFTLQQQVLTHNNSFVMDTIEDDRSYHSKAVNKTVEESGMEIT